MAPVLLAPLDTTPAGLSPATECDDENNDHENNATELSSSTTTSVGSAKLEDPLLRWILDKSKNVEDLRFASHGASHGARRYDSFLQAKREIEAIPMGDKLFHAQLYYDTRSYECRDIPSERPGTLRIIFEYYSRLLTPTSVNTGLTEGNAPLTLALIEVANNTISLTELVTFACNYGIVPNIISHAGLHFAWQRQRRTRSNEHPTELDYPSFVQVLARCALIAFEGDPKSRVDQFIAFMDLPNTAKHIAMLEALEKTRNGKHRPTKNIRHAPVSLDEEKQSGSKKHNFKMVSSRKQRWSRIDIKPTEIAAQLESLQQSAGRVGDVAPPTFENDPMRKDRKRFWNAEKHWDPELLDLLAPFEFEHHRKRWIPFHGEFLDMGVLVRGSTHHYRIILQNACPFTAHAVMCFRGIPETEVHMDAREMAAGLSKESLIRIRCINLGEHHGYLHVKLLDSEDQLVQERQIPVYCNIVESQAVQAALLAREPKGQTILSKVDETLQHHRKRSEQEIARRIAWSKGPASPKSVGTPHSPNQHNAPFVGALALPSPSRRILGVEELSSFERRPLPVSLTNSDRPSPTSLASRRANLHRAQASAKANMNFS